MFEILEEVISVLNCSSLSQLTNIFFESNFKVKFMRIGRNQPLYLYIKCSHKNYVCFYAAKTQITMGFMRPIAGNQGSDKKHPIYFSRTRAYSSIFK